MYTNGSRAEPEQPRVTEPVSETRRPRPGSERPAGNGARPVSEGEPIRITLDDVTQANQLSLNCPICASPVERNVPTTGAAPVICTECGTLYHRACWESTGAKCAMIGCSSTSMRLYGEAMGPVLTIRRSDLDKVPPGYRNKQLKAQEVRRSQPQKSATFWERLFRRILDAFR